MAARDSVDSSILGGKTAISYRDEGGQLQPFSPHTTACIVRGLAKSKRRLSFKRRKKETFRVDLKRMKRVHVGSGKESDIVVEICSKLAIEKIGGKFGRRELLSTLLEDLCSIDFFKGRVAEMASPYKISSIRVNHHAARGTELYIRFLDALEKKANEIPGLLGEIVELVLRCRGFEEKSSIQYVFHGTPQENLSSICERGMDPSLRMHLGDYFGMNAQTSVTYTVEKDLLRTRKYTLPGRLSLLVFFVLLPGPTRYLIESLAYPYKLMNETSHELPIAIVQLDRKFS